MNVAEGFEKIHDLKAKRTRALAKQKAAKSISGGTKSTHPKAVGPPTTSLLKSPDQLYRPPNSAVKRWHDDYDARWEALQKVLSEHKPNIQVTSPVRTVTAG